MILSLTEFLMLCHVNILTFHRYTRIWTMCTKKFAIDFSFKRQKNSRPKLSIYQFYTHHVIPLKCNRINTRWMWRRHEYSLPRWKTAYYNQIFFFHKLFIALKSKRGWTKMAKNRVKNTPIYVFCVSPYECDINSVRTHFSNIFFCIYPEKTSFCNASFAWTWKMYWNSIWNINKKSSWENFRTLCQ